MTDAEITSAVEPATACDPDLLLRGIAERWLNGTERPAYHQGRHDVRALLWLVMLERKRITEQKARAAGALHNERLRHRNILSDLERDISRTVDRHMEAARDE